MANNIQVQILMLKMRNVIGIREMAIATANRELANGGWQCNWEELSLKCTKEFEQYEKQLQEIVNGK